MKLYNEEQIVEKKVTELVPYKNNPRNNNQAMETLTNSIKEFGFRIPIIIDENNVIVCGHTRLMAAKQLGLEKVPCIVVTDLTEEQIKAFRLVDNKVSEFSIWDYDKLDEELDKIVNIDMNLFNFAIEEPDFNWDDIEDLTDKNYVEPEAKMMTCPLCHNEDYAIHFKTIKVPVEEEKEEE